MENEELAMLSETGPQRGWIRWSRQLEWEMDKKEGQVTAEGEEEAGTGHMREEGQQKAKQPDGGENMEMGKCTWKRKSASNI